MVDDDEKRERRVKLSDLVADTYRTEIDAWREEAANRKKLSDCTKPHTFFEYRPLVKAYRCAKCGGAVTYQDAYWYRQGLIDATNP